MKVWIAAKDDGEMRMRKLTQVNKVNFYSFSALVKGDNRSAKSQMSSHAFSRGLEKAHH